MRTPAQQQAIRVAYKALTDGPAEAAAVVDGLIRSNQVQYDDRWAEDEDLPDALRTSSGGDAEAK